MPLWPISSNFLNLKKRIDFGAKDRFALLGPVLKQAAKQKISTALCLTTPNVFT